MQNEFATEFTNECVKRITESAARIRGCVNELSEDELWHRPNGHLSSVANLVLHLCGNVSQYIILSLGHGTYSRERDKEFAAHKSHSKAELQVIFADTMERAVAVIQAVTVEELLRPRVVQGFTMTGIGVVVHVTEHLSYHTGQIAMHTKLHKDKDLGFYSGLNLNQ